MTGGDIPRYRPFDNAIVGLLRKEDIPGAAFALAMDGRLVHSRGYGVVRRGSDALVQPETRFRIASVTKPLTAVAVMCVLLDRRDPTLLDSPVVAAAGLSPRSDSGKPIDPRIATITVRHLLLHRGGWDRDKSGDPMFQHARVARDLGRRPPLVPKDYLEWGLARPLDFDPGTKSVYSNFGYNLLGRWIEAMSGQAYAEYVRDRVLRPMGIPGMSVGGSVRAGVAGEEVEYHMPRMHPLQEMPYTEIIPAVMDSHGGWLASATELVRFASLFDNPRGGGLPGDMARRMTERPPAPLGRGKDGQSSGAFQGLGWMVRPEGRSATIWHLGIMDGTTATLIRRADRVSWALLLNQRTDVDVDALLHAAASLSIR